MKRTDGDVEGDVIQVLNDDPRFTGADLRVRVEDGVAHLAGTVSTWGVKMAVQEAARRVPGLSAVRNLVEFRLGDGARRSDADVSRAVRQALEQDVPAPQPRVRFSVSAGWVTLEGAVDHWKQRGDVERAVRKLPGVLGVANKVELRASAPWLDEPQHPATRV